MLTILPSKRPVGNVHKAACKCTSFLLQCHMFRAKNAQYFTICLLVWSRLLKNTVLFCTKE